MTSKTRPPLITLLPDPDNVGEAEYRALHELLDTALEEYPPSEQPQAAIAILVEVRQWAESLIKRINGFEADMQHIARMGKKVRHG